MEKRIVYFEKPGKTNTEACVSIVKDAIKKEGYKYVVAASTTGDTGLMLGEALAESDAKLVVVTHSSGFKEPNHMEMPKDVRDRIKSYGAEVYTGSMLTHSLDTAFSQKFGGSYLTQIVANSLRRFGEGAKVACECVMMAVDAGLVPEDEEVLSVAGTARGADTVLLIKSAASKRFLNLRVLEVLAKPRV
ncbi:hypothetical protein GTO10_03530 [Candidatus Saccharibacteria bacterium]|nr:hypothetical protein [Candidatus Saccharibacteria bacterium]